MSDTDAKALDLSPEQVAELEAKIVEAAAATAEFRLSPGEALLVLSAQEVLVVFGVLNDTSLKGADLRVAGRLLDRLEPEAVQASEFLRAAAQPRG